MTLSRLEDMQNVREFMVNYYGLSKKFLDGFFSTSYYYQQHQSPFKILLGSYKIFFKKY
jgi:hypothetical protein